VFIVYQYDYETSSILVSYNARKTKPEHLALGGFDVGVVPALS